MKSSTLTLAELFPSAPEAVPIYAATLRPSVPRGRSEGLVAAATHLAVAEPPAVYAPELTELDRRVARCELEGWPNAGRAPIVEGLPAWQRAAGGPFCAVPLANLETVALGVPVVHEGWAFFAWDEEPLALRLRADHTTYLFEVRDGSARAWVEPFEGNAPPLLAWLGAAAPPWLEVEIRSRLDAATPLAWSMALGLALRFGQPPGTLATAEVLARVRAGLPPRLVALAQAWAAARPEAEWTEAVTACHERAAGLAQALRAFQPGVPGAGVEALRLCHERDDLESLRATLRVARRAAPVEPVLAQLDHDAEDTLPALGDEATAPSARLDAAGTAFPSPWWAHASPRGRPA